MEQGKAGRARSDRISAAEYRALVGGTSKGSASAAGGRRSGKFNAQRVSSDEGEFDSKGEYQRYLDLRMLERLGRIRDLKRQVRIPLIVNGGPLLIRDKTGRGRKLSYVADFTYYEDDVYVVEDFKGFDTPVSRIKRAIVEATCALTVRVTRR